MMQLEEVLFYDIEVFSHDNIVVFKDIDKNVVKIFHNKYNELSEFIKGKTLIGFNNYHYDDIVLHSMLQLKTPKQIKELNDKIINKGRVPLFLRKFDSLDCFQQIDVSMPSLKKIEGNMGRKILESSVPFSIKTPLTESQLKEVIDYCSYDVDTTIDIYKMRLKSYFLPKIELVKMLGKEKAMYWNTTTISANLLTKGKIVKKSYINTPDHMKDLVPPEVWELWTEKEKGSITIQEFNNTILFAFGGLHGAHQTIKKVKNVKLLDVTSMYPNIILILRTLENFSEKYRAILEKRIQIKHVDKILSEALKLILNSVYGNLNNEYSLLYNPKGLLSVCAYGQIALYNLCKCIAPFATIININTDGVAFIPHDMGYIEAYKEWEKDFSLSLEEKEFELFIQKDVNNYIARTTKGELICKGGDVNRYEGDAFFKNNNARILDIALVDYLLFGKDIFETLLENRDKPHLFQYILKAGNTYKGTFDVYGNEYNKVNRVFAAKEEGFCLYKKRYDDGLVRFADSPLNMHLWNNDCNEIQDFNSIIDLNHYYQIIMKRLERWM